MALDPATCLADAELALHALLTGKQAVKVDVGDGKTVTYTQADEGALRNYIAELKGQVDTTGNTRRRPLRPFF